MKTKFKILTAFVAVLLGLYSCEDIYDDIELNEANSRIIATSQMNFTNTIRIGNSITLGDLSSGVASRLWTLPTGVADIVGSDNDETSTEQNVKAIFNAEGEHDVVLSQVFKGEAYDLAGNIIGKEIDTTIVVTVLPEIKTVLKAYRLNEDGSQGDELSLTSGANNEVTAGKAVRFIVDESTQGSPDSFVWTAEGGTRVSLSEDKRIYDVRYKKTGSFGLELISSLARPVGEEIITLTSLINVIPSTEPVQLDGIEAVGTSIFLNFSRDMDETTGVPSDFVVSIDNGGISNPAITSITVDPDTANFVELKLDIPQFYSDDMISLSYTKGSLSTLDGVIADSFTDEEAVLIEQNLLIGTSYDYSMETGGADWKDVGWGGVWGQFTAVVNDARAKTGTMAAQAAIEANGGMIYAYKPEAIDNAKFTFEAGKNYKLGAWVYITTPVTGTADLRFYVVPPFKEVFIAELNASTPLDKWVYISSDEFNFLSDTTSEILIRGNNQNNGAELLFTIDDITITEVVNKP